MNRSSFLKLSGTIRRLKAPAFGVEKQQKAIDRMLTTAVNCQPSSVNHGLLTDTKSLDCLSTSGEMGFTFFTDSLAVGNYLYTGIYGDMFVLSYNGTDEFVHDPADSISFNITSYSKGHISGNFSGRLTPMIVAGNPNNTYGSPGSVLITKGSFKDVPVFY